MRHRRCRRSYLARYLTVVTIDVSNAASRSLMIAIGGRGRITVGPDYFAAGLWRWIYAAPGAKVKLTPTSGDDITITLAEYY